MVGHGPNAVSVADRSAAEFLDQECHGCQKRGSATRTQQGGGRHGYRLDELRPVLGWAGPAGLGWAGGRWPVLGVAVRTPVPL